MAKDKKKVPAKKKAAPKQKNIIPGSGAAAKAESAIRKRHRILHSL